MPIPDLTLLGLLWLQVLLVGPSPLAPLPRLSSPPGPAAKEAPASSGLQLSSQSEFLCTVLLPAGSEDGHVLPEDKASRQPHPVHPEQGEAGGEERQGRGGEGAEHGGHGLLPGEPRGVPHVWVLRSGQARPQLLC